MRRLLSSLLAFFVLCSVPLPVHAEDREIVVEGSAIQSVTPGQTPHVLLSAINIHDVTVTVRRLSNIHSRLVPADRSGDVVSQTTVHLGHSHASSDFEWDDYITLPAEKAGTYYYRIDGGQGHFAEGLVQVTDGNKQASATP